jgi:hypothetical protein
MVSFHFLSGAKHYVYGSHAWHNDIMRMTCLFEGFAGRIPYWDPAVHGDLQGYTACAFRSHGLLTVGLICVLC